MKAWNNGDKVYSGVLWNTEGHFKGFAMDVRDSV